MTHSTLEQGTLTILAVDDDPVVREVLAMTFAAPGWELSIAATGGEALELAPGLRPDLVLLDLTMRGMDGIATKAALEGVDGIAGVPVVFLTADARAASGLRTRVPGTAGVILKPFDPLRLPDALRAIVLRSRDSTSAPELSTPSAEPAPSLQDTLMALWERRRPEVRDQVRDLEAKLANRQAHGDGGVVVADARLLAHTLAGALGSLGLGRSCELVRALERQLDDVQGSNLGASLEPMLDVLARLRDAIETETPAL